MQNLRDIRDARDILRLAHGDAVLWQFERLSDIVAQHGRECAAADEHDSLRRRAVEPRDFRRDGAREIADLRQDGLYDILRGQIVARAEDIAEMHPLAVCRLPFDVLRHIEIEQEILADGLGDLIARLRHHAVGDDGAVLRDGDIARARADIDEHEVEVAHCRRDEHVDGSDWLKCECLHREPRCLKRRLHGVDDLPRQEGRDDFRARDIAALSDEALQLAAVELIADRAVADAVVMRRIVHRM